MAGAPFRNLVNQILAALSDQNAGSTEPTNPFAGMVWLDTSTNPSVLKLRNDGNTGWITIFTSRNPPTKTQIGLPYVPNYSATASLTDGSMTKFLLAAAGKALNDNKLDKGAASADALKLGGKLASQYVLISGTYANLRAQATTKADVDLGNVQNCGITSSLTSNNSNLYLSAKGGYDLNQMKVNKTLTINGKQLTGNITLTPADVSAFAASGGNLGGAINYTPDTGDIIKVDGKTLLRRTTLAGGVSFGADESMIIGCGEARQTLEDNVTLTSELMHMGSDGAIHFYTNLQAGWTNRKTFTLEDDGGLVVPNAAKTRQNLDVPANDSVYPKTETYSRTEVAQEITDRLPVTGYALLDFGVITTNSRYVKSNPFGSNTPVICIAEIAVSNVWGDPGFVYVQGSGGYGTAAHYVIGEGIIVQTGLSAISSSGFDGGGALGSIGNLGSASCRVHIWRCSK